MEKTLKILNEEGMHARPAGVFVKKANEFKSSVLVKTAAASKNGKSIMGLMSLGLKAGDSITIETTGEDAEQCLLALTTLVENKFQS
jgi:phosphocarrier protein